ncbi:hypothetical protein GGD66_007504 [Bradyrhizobium sp. CIR48]|nr:hypothetical protein [Bradyrhizobium sp. CIR18]MBB4393749.1 hypothetical protein [Bradyrhizobium sp. ERR14]MBB4428906.1 hypothetical protein [Bradyrhizobium sp. CIR48]
MEPDETVADDVKVTLMLALERLSLWSGPLFFSMTSSTYR